jgi:hypothetical protein
MRFKEVLMRVYTDAFKRHPAYIYNFGTNYHLYCAQLYTICRTDLLQCFEGLDTISVRSVLSLYEARNSPGLVIAARTFFSRLMRTKRVKIRRVAAGQP